MLAPLRNVGSHEIKLLQEIIVDACQTIT
uniref:Uncharacterized protein n=1 Tax=Arundo donax TaxID=35708 RepID=A0A0A9GTS2_ARUDO